MTLGVLHDDPVSRVHDDPAIVNQDFSNHMLGGVLGRQKEQAAHSQIGTSREIQEGVRRRAADVQQLAVSKRHFRIACCKCIRVGRDGSRWVGTHPVQNGLDFLFRGLAIGYNCVGESVEIPAHGVFPDARIKHRYERSGQQQVAAPPDDTERTMLAPWQAATPSVPILPSSPDAKQAWRTTFPSRERVHPILVAT